jgi:hypothetical protein
MSVFEIVVEPMVRRRRVRQTLSGKQRASSLFRVWHGLRDMIEEAEHLGDGELVHFLSVAQMLVEEKVASVTSGIAISFDGLDTSWPN